MTGGHIEENAALYALGALTDEERAAIDAHLRECELCAHLVGAAEDDVARMVSLQPQRAAPAALAGRIDAIVHAPSLQANRRVWRTPQQFAAIAAALVVGLLPSAYLWEQNQAMHGAMLAQSQAIDRVMTAPHRMASFRATTVSPPADVMYALDGSWYVVVVRDATKPLSVAWMHGGARTMLGDAVPHGGTAMLYLPKSHRMDRLALMDGDRVVAEATLSWEGT